MILKATCSDGRVVEFDGASPIGQGGEKVVFFSKDKREVICFFMAGLEDRFERRRRIEKILSGFNPTTGANGDFWKKYFCWPTHLVDGDRAIPKTFLKEHQIVDPPLAVVSPTYRSTFFFKNTLGKTVEGNGKWFTSERCRKLVPVEYQGGFQDYLRVCIRMARAVRRMHFAGLAHSDLSNKNVLVSPKHGDACIIDIDSLVVPGVAPPSVIGTPGYIAPEVLSAKIASNGKPTLPSVETDRHALAVLIYENLFKRHPLRGPKVNSRLSAEEDELLSLGAKAVFVDHSRDLSNRLSPPPDVPLSAAGVSLEELFRKAFEVGLHEPAKRPDAAQWERALCRTYDQLYPSPDERNSFVVTPGSPLLCPFSKRSVGSPVPFARVYSFNESRNEYRLEKYHIVVHHNKWLHTWHITSGTLPGESADDTPKGYFSFFNGAWYLVNISGGPMFNHGGGEVRHNESVLIEKGLKLVVGEGPRGILFDFDFVDPLPA